MYRWHIITGEYPPQVGGVGDYTRLVADELARAGDDVNVWAPEGGEPDDRGPGVRVHRLPGHFGPRALAIMERAIGGAGDCRLLVQYVPHAFGFKAMNLPFSYWLYKRRDRYDISVMFHEVAFPRRTVQPLRHNLLGEVTSLMAALVARSATRIFISSAAWEDLVHPMMPPDRAITWLPVPSTIPLVRDSGASEAIRAKYAAGGPLVGHFGTYGAGVTKYLETALPGLLQDARVNVILLGRGGSAFREALAKRHPRSADRLHATDGLIPEELSVHLSACDLMIQPYPDGITTRRTTAMAALSHGCPVVTTVGRLSEPLWAESGAIAAVADDDAAGLAALASSLIHDEPERQRLGLAAARLYRERFDLRHTIDALRVSDADSHSQLVQP